MYTLLEHWNIGTTSRKPLINKRKSCSNYGKAFGTKPIDTTVPTAIRLRRWNNWFHIFIGIIFCHKLQNPIDTLVPLTCRRRCNNWFHIDFFKTKKKPSQKLI